MKNVLAVLFTILFSISISAQSDYAKKGVIDLGGSISFSSTTSVSNGETSDNSVTQFGFSPLIGYFVIDGLELALVPQITTYSYGDYSSTSINIFAAPAYNFNTGTNAFPYVAGLIGYTSTSDDNGQGSNTYSGVSYGGAAGVKIGVTEKAMLNIGLQYLLITENPDNADKRYGYNQFSISAGFLVWFN